MNVNSNHAGHAAFPSIEDSLLSDDFHDETSPLHPIDLTEIPPDHNFAGQSNLLSEKSSFNEWVSKRPNAPN